MTSHANSANPALNVPTPELETSVFPRPPRRQAYLESKLSDNQPIIVIISGLSCSGKTVILNAATELGVSCGERLMPRNRRAGDTPGDTKWCHSSRSLNSKQGGIGSDKIRFVDLTGPNRVFFAEYKYQGYYGFTSENLVRALKSGTSVGYIVGRCEEIPAMIEGIQNIAPLTPICVVRTQVPTPILTERLKDRPEAFPGELAERVGKLHEMEALDCPQIPELEKIYGMRTILNLAPSEVRRHNSVAGAEPATPEYLKRVLQEEVNKARHKNSRSRFRHFAGKKIKLRPPLHT